MTETTMTIGGQIGACRLVVRSVQGAAGLGIGRIGITLDMTSGDPAVEHLPLHLSGHVDVYGLGTKSGYLGQITVQDRFLRVPTVTGNINFTVMVPITRHQLQEIEDNRSGPITLKIWIAGETIRDGTPEQIYSQTSLDHQLTQSDWAQVLDQLQFRKTLLLELPAPDIATQPHLAAAIAHYQLAQASFGNGAWRSTVESLRQSLAAIAGERPEDEASAADVSDGLKGAAKQRGPYNERYEAVRRAMKFLCDLGAHPETDETLRRDASSTLLMVGGLLHRYTAVS